MSKCLFILHFSAQHIPGVTAYTEAAHAQTHMELYKMTRERCGIPNSTHGYTWDTKDAYLIWNACIWNAILTTKSVFNYFKLSIWGNADKIWGEMLWRYLTSRCERWRTEGSGPHETRQVWDGKTPARISEFATHKCSVTLIKTETMWVKCQYPTSLW